MKRVLAIGDRRVAGLGAAGAEVFLVENGVDAAAILDAAGDDVALVVLTPEVAQALGDGLAARPRLLGTVGAP